MHSTGKVVRIPEPGTILYSFDTMMSEGKVIDRPNRFIVNVRTEDGDIISHIHDPGRLKELIYPGNRVILRPTAGIRTAYSVTAAAYGDEMVLTDTRIHSAIAGGFLPANRRSEVKVGRHRIDFMVDDCLIEVKGCTLLDGNVAKFPDAPTVRGKEHMSLLADHVRNGGRAIAMILVLRENAECFVPNTETDPEFSREFSSALGSGVEVFIPRLSFDGIHVTYHGQLGLCDSPEK